MYALLLATTGCLLWDDTPYLENVATHADSDADGVTVGDGDCNDADPDVHPGAPDTCDGIDNDCNGEVDEVLPSTVWCQDVDGDSHGDVAHQTRTCFPEEGWVQDCTDCDDGNRGVNPGETEICNGTDDDCDDLVDPPDAQGAADWWPDRDNDGYGDPGRSERSCEPPAGAVQNDADCDDSAADTYPGAVEVCGDGHLNNCDGDGKECGWSGSSTLRTDTESFISGPDTTQEYFGITLGFADTNGDGIEDLVLSGLGEMYGGEDRGALHVWQGAPIGRRTVTEAAAHISGVPNQFLGITLHGPPAVRVEDAVSGESHLLIAAPGGGEGFDECGTVLSYDEGVYGDLTAAPSHIFARGRSPYEAFGATLYPAGNIVETGNALVVGASHNDERGSYSGAVYIVSISAPNADSAVATIHGEENGLFGDNAVVGQDFDGDGCEDIIVASGYVSSPSLFFYAGPLSGVYEASDADGVVSDRNWATGTTVAVGDVDADGRTDLALQGNKEVQIIQGDLTATDNSEAVILGVLEVDGQPINGQDYGLAVADFGHDGVTDLAVGIPYWDADAKFGGAVEAGAVAVVPLDRSYLGGSDLWASASAVFYGPDAEANLGLPLAAGDVNADGYPDLLAAAADWEGNGYQRAGAVWFILGGGI